EGHERALVYDILNRVESPANEFKRRQLPPTLIISRNAIGIGRRRPVTHRFKRQPPAASEAAVTSRAADPRDEGRAREAKLEYSTEVDSKGYRTEECVRAARRGFDFLLRLARAPEYFEAWGSDFLNYFYVVADTAADSTMRRLGRDEGAKLARRWCRHHP